MIDGDFHELTPAVPPPDVAEDVRHKNPYDRHAETILFMEPHAAMGVLTQDGVTQIAFHKYKAGEYTFLDTLLNPTWTALTELLPRWLAPNMVTTLGGLHCLAAYIFTWSYAPNFYTTDDTSDSSQNIPNAVLLVNAYCCAAYYTLDCMDGKQARRTGTSSPLGQLFDHGVDCLCLQQHLSMCMTMLALTPQDSAWIWMAQAMLQFSFYMAQWEEYYTGVLPHATGNVGVTEVNYGLALTSFLNAVLVPDRLAFYNAHVRVPSIVAQSPVWSRVLEFLGNEPDPRGIQLNHLALLGWYGMVMMLVTLCMVRVMTQTSGKRFSALSKLVSPALLCIAPFWVGREILARECRWFSLAFGLALTQITNKTIVFSMARQAVAALQVDDVVPLTLCAAWIKYDERWKDPGITLLLQVLTVCYGIRFVLWTQAAFYQICERLDINLFTIKVKRA